MQKEDFAGSGSATAESNPSKMRDFIVKHPMLSTHVVGVAAGLAGAAAGLKWRAIIVLAFAVGIAYAVWSNRLEDAARRTARSPASKAEVSGQDDGAKPIHPE
ncbi:MAG TPA: hypothetical protein VKH81_21895 [Candidatus Angelobacter sp.]|nr:hypothetical protein [Candidatus Angelobacter sp.]